jgi:hypothetical protein
MSVPSTRSYLESRELADDEVRRRIGWDPGDVIPRWMAMRSH